MQMQDRRRLRVFFVVIAVLAAALASRVQAVAAQEATPVAQGDPSGVTTVVVTLVDRDGAPFLGQCLEVYAIEGEDWLPIATVCDGDDADAAAGVITFELDAGPIYAFTPTVTPPIFVDEDLSIWPGPFVGEPGGVVTATLVFFEATSATFEFFVGTPGGPPNVLPPLAPLASACFGLREAGGGATEPSCSDAVGTLRFADLTAGTYAFEVVSLPAGCQPYNLPTVTVQELQYGPFPTDFVEGIAVLCAGQGTAHLTIHAVTCPADAADPFAACHANGRAGIAFFPHEFLLVEPFVTDDRGVAVGEVIAGRVVLFEAFDTFGFDYGAYVVCTEQRSGVVLLDERTPDNDVVFDAVIGDEIVCDWYALTAPTGEHPDGGSDGGATNTDGDAGDDTGASGVTTLPNTGAAPGDAARGGLGGVGLLALLLAGRLMRRGARRRSAAFRGT